jgi:hypothetical protein
MNIDSVYITCYESEDLKTSLKKCEKLNFKLNVVKTGYTCIGGGWTLNFVLSCKGEKKNKVFKRKMQNMEII